MIKTNKGENYESQIKTEGREQEKITNKYIQSITIFN